jgi:hypothetical protein
VSNLVAVRNGVVSAITPGMTPANPFHGEPRAAECAVCADGPHAVFGTARSEAALGGRAQDEQLERGQRPAIQLEQQNENELERVHWKKPV